MAHSVSSKIDPQKTLECDLCDFVADNVTNYLQHLNDDHNELERSYLLGCNKYDLSMKEEEEKNKDYMKVKGKLTKPAKETDRKKDTWQNKVALLAKAKTHFKNESGGRNYKSIKSLNSHRNASHGILQHQSKDAEIEKRKVTEEIIRNKSVVDKKESNNKKKKEEMMADLVEKVNGRFTCAECDYSNLRKNRILDHIFKTHKKQFECQTCHIWLTHSDMAIHEKSCKKVAGSQQAEKVVTTSDKYNMKEEEKYNDSEEMEENDFDVSKEKEEEEEDHKEDEQDREEEEEEDQEVERKEDEEEEVVNSSSHKKYKCKECDYSNRFSDLLADHFSAVHRNIKRHPCDSCNSRFTNKKGLTTHIKIVHEQVRFHCDQCDQKLSSRNALKNHIGSVHKKLRPHQCERCGSKFSRSGSLRQHVVTVHDNVKGFKCDQCDLRVTSRLSLKRHIQSVHEKLKPHNCDTCGKEFSLGCNLKRHVESVHEKQRPFACDQCDLRVASRGGLKKHINAVHMKLKPHGCDICNSKFSFRASLRLHVETVHEETKAFKCDRCGHRFSTHCNLIRHKKVAHDNKRMKYPCDSCGVVFSVQKSLANHISEVHEKDKAHKCKKCNGSFDRIAELTKHLNVAHGYLPEIQESKAIQ